MSFQSQFLKYFSLRLESLLLFVPLFLFLILYYSYDSVSIDPYFGVTVPYILSTNIILFHIPFFIIPYLMHRFMRDQDKGHITVNYIHVLLSLFLMFSLMFTYQVVQPSFPNHGTEIFNLPDNKMWMEPSMSTYVILVFQIFMQLVFTIYSLTVLFPAKTKQQIPSYN
ncbi:MAG: hypothetical protein EAZ62_07720 [Sphingobacteriia bacterium]|nr:MAG: hypothetical protein EAZ62_07720 [Sphingobacteriia bacterium]